MRLTRAQLDRALLKLFDEEGTGWVPRCYMPRNLYEYVHALWARSLKGQRELWGRK